MTKEEFEEQLISVAEIQRNAGWSEESIRLYAEEQRAFIGDDPSGVLMIGAGLACDNSRFGVVDPRIAKRAEQATLAAKAD